MALDEYSEDEKLILFFTGVSREKLTPIKVSRHGITDFEDVKIERKMCFQNAYEISSIDMRYQYCLCAAVNNIAFEHAIVFDTEEQIYLDPTLQKYGDVDTTNYYLVEKFTIDELIEIILKYKYAPTLQELFLDKEWDKVFLDFGGTHD
ncbi:hypothetical protein [Photobacterium damselae]|uniref:hypothetical protein n=1 Tax=Photobacterium damselae TaxID=38293 RepID=UPI001F1DD1D2|nr:hypothetical protein [Photobacterium damselae]UKA04823.1 hypothetical protein IHC89_21510 [Photobacterium damselae subsp. damselae]